jgi:hypothetical protein
MGGRRKPNRLINEKSPYLLQHAYNPVEWYPWGEEAFEKAEKEDKPVFLSIGYSTCHWCHVMKRESFEDDQVASLLNEKFVPVKVDREERPDIDGTYMSVCQLLTGNGGWPLTIMMTPEKRPFFAGTYFPRESKFGRIGLIDLLQKVSDVWQRDRQKLLDDALKNTRNLADLSRMKANGQDLTEEILDEAFIGLADSFDPVNGGFGSRPKFPTPNNLLFLLRYWKRRKNQKALRMVEKTLQKMRLGGIFDQVGLGFHRYSTDSSWLVPHFEKMLYDQALISLAYTEAYQATAKKEYRRTAEEIFEYVLASLSHPEGPFYSAEDAESEDEEGKFYLWTEAEVKEELGDASFLVEKAFDIHREGNYVDELLHKRTGKNILHLKKPLGELASELGMNPQELEDKVEEKRKALLDTGKTRVPPAKDDQILTDWNGLMIAALATAGQAFNESRYREAATRAGEFILENLQTPEGRLLHRFRDGEAALPGNVDDYAFFIWGLIELYEVTFELRFLSEAVRLQDTANEHFWDPDSGGFFFTADDSEEILIRYKEVRDGALPSGNSVELLNLLRLARMTANEDYTQKAERLVKAFSSQVSQSPIYDTMFLASLDFLFGPSHEIVLVGDLDSKKMIDMLDSIRTKYLPNKIVLVKTTEDSKLENLAGYTRNMKTIKGETTAYICKNFACKAPTTDTHEVEKTLTEN